MGSVSSSPFPIFTITSTFIPPSVITPSGMSQTTTLLPAYVPVLVLVLVLCGIILELKAHVYFVLFPTGAWLSVTSIWVLSELL